MSHRNQARSVRTRPLLETLEDRTCLSANVTLLNGNTVVISGSDGDLPNLLTITQNDASNELRIVCQRAPGSPASTWDGIYTYQSSAIKSIVVKTGVGDDQFYYNLVGDMLYAKSLNVDLGGGNNTAAFNMDGVHSSTGLPDNGQNAFFGVDPVPEGETTGVTATPVTQFGPANSVDTNGTANPQQSTFTEQTGVTATPVAQFGPATPVEMNGGANPQQQQFTEQTGVTATPVAQFGPATPVELIGPQPGPQIVTPPSTIKANLNIVLQSGSGTDTVDAFFGNVATGARVSYQANLGAGDDSGSVTLGGTVAKGAYVSLSQDGGVGSDKLIFDGGESTVDAGATLAVFLNGGNKVVGNGLDKGDDNLVANYAGTLNGVMKVSVDGGAGNDVIDGSIIAGGNSTGYLNVSALGNAGNDTITLTVLSSAPSSHTAVFVDGGAGKDTVIVTGAAKPTVLNAETMNFTKK